MKEDALDKVDDQLLTKNCPKRMFNYNMLRVIFNREFGRELLITFLIIVSCLLPVTAQEKRATKKNRCEGVQNLRDASLLSRYDRAAHKLLADFTEGLELRIASRKTSYMFDEIITLDIALLNRTSTPFFAFAPSPQTVVVSAMNSEKNVILVGAYEVNQLGHSTNMYRRLGGGAYTTGRVNVLIGCSKPNSYTKQKVERLNSLMNSQQNTNEALFAEGWFISWGDFCLDAKESGAYEISVETNAGEYVVSFPDCPSDTKTVVSKIKSRPLEINIAKIN